MSAATDLTLSEPPSGNATPLGDGFPLGWHGVVVMDSLNQLSRDAPHRFGVTGVTPGPVSIEVEIAAETVG